MTVNTTALAGLLALFCAQGAYAAAPIPVESFAQEPTYSTPRMSPDGKHIAINVRIARNGRMIPTMSVFTLPELKRVSTIAMNGYEIPVDFHWISNRRLVVSKGLVLAAREMPVTTGELVAVDFDGTHQEYLYGYDNFKSSSKGTRYGDDYGYGEVAAVFTPRTDSAYVGTYLWGAERSMLYDINTVNASRKLVADIAAPYLDFLVQDDKTPRFAFGTNDEADPSLYRYDDASREWKLVDKKTLGARYHPFAFTAKDKEVYASYSPDGGPEKIVRDAVDGSSRVVVAEDPLGSVTRFAYTAMPFVPFGARTDIGIPKLRYLDANLPEAKLHKMLSDQFPGEFVTFINFTDDGQKLLFHVASDRDPGSYYTFDRQNGQANLLFSNMEQIDPEQMAERLPIEFKARDGLTLTGYLTLPKDAAHKKAPLVIMPHGGPAGINDTWFFDTDAQFLASRGYAVLQVNFRGSGGRGLKFMNAGQHQWGGAMMDDLIDGVKWAGTRADVDAKRVCTYGASFGGYAALMLPIREQAMFKCAIGYAGLYDLNMVFEEHNVRSRKSSKSFYLRWLGSDKAELDRYSPALQAEKIKVPVLLVHGGKDEVCPKEQAYKMRENLTKAGSAPEWHFVPEEGHGFYDVENRRALYVKLEAFLAKHIGN
jgi:dipeptidyl aminopeptidase/acylaminoacyl peptidase